jgi:type IV pilus assembly protein PilA
MNIKKKSGFTLIEIIVVLIIVGVLAAIALPNLFGNVAKSRGAEALASLSALKSNVEACYQAKSNIGTSCSGVAGLGAQGNFTYTIVTGASVWSLIGSNANGTVSLARDAAGAIVCTASGSFGGIC